MLSTETGVSEPDGVAVAVAESEAEEMEGVSSFCSVSDTTRVPSSAIPQALDEWKEKHVNKNRY